jgi:hypothetical protein
MAMEMMLRTMTVMGFYNVKYVPILFDVYVLRGIIKKLWNEEWFDQDSNLYTTPKTNPAVCCSYETTIS